MSQNVDGLHDRGGSRNVLKVHGSIWELRCRQCGVRTVDLRTPLPALPPACGDCGGLLRPGVVWFGEQLPEDVRERAERAARQSHVFLVAGTSANVYPAAGLVSVAKRSGAAIVEVNLEPTGVTSLADHVLAGRAGEILRELVAPAAAK